MFVFFVFFLLGTTVLAVLVAMQPGPFGSWPFLGGGGGRTRGGVREPLGGTEYSPLQKDRHQILTCPLRMRRFLIPPPLNKEGKGLAFWLFPTGFFFVVVPVVDPGIRNRWTK